MSANSLQPLSSALLFRSFILRPLISGARAGDRLRTALSIVAVGLGVGVVLAIQIASRNSVHSFENSLLEISGRTNLSIRGTNGIDESLLPRIQEIVGDQTRVSPVLDGTAVVASTHEAIQVLGVDLLQDKFFRDASLIDSGASERDSLLTLLDPHAILVSEGFASKHGLTAETELAMLINDRRETYNVRGLLKLQGPAKALGGNVAIMDIAAAQLAFAKIGSLDRIDLIAPAGDLASVERRLNLQLPSGLRAERPQTTVEQAGKMLRAFRWNLAALSYVSLIVGAFLIYNTIAISVVRRRPEIGILRSLGATRRRVLKLFLAEAAILGVAGGIAGIVLGRLLAGVAVRLVSTTVKSLYFATPSEPPRLDAPLALEALALAVVVSLVSALLPALEATRVGPAEAMQSGAYESQRKIRSGPYAIVGLLILVFSAAIAALPSLNGFPLFGYLAAVLVVAAFSCLMPLFLSASMTALEWPMEKIAGVQGLMAARGLAASPSRVSILTMSLTTAVAMMASVAIMVGSFRDTVDVWASQTLRAELFLKPVAQRTQTDATISPEALDIVRSTPGVKAVDPYRGVDTVYKGSRVVLGSGDWITLARFGNLLFLDGRPANAVLSGDSSHRAVVSEPFAIHFGIRTGQEIEIDAPSGKRKFLVAGVYYDYSNDRGTIVIDRPVYTSLFEDNTASTLAVYLNAGENSEVVARRLSERLAANGYQFLITQNGVLHASVLRVFDRTFAITYALEVVAIVVAALGIANALLALIIERRREMGITRVLGATRGQLRRMILAEAALVGLLGNVVGWLMGLLLSLDLIYVINKQSFGWTIQFSYPAKFLALSGISIFVVTVLAGLYPARVAGRFHPAEVISVE